MYTTADAKRLFDILESQSSLLANIIDTQKKIHEAVIAKNWESLQIDLATLDALSQKFALVEHERDALCTPPCAEESGDSAEQRLEANDFYDTIALFPREEQDALVGAFTKLRRKLFTSKIENTGLTAYLKITRDFLQGIFDTAVPNRRSRVYSHTGAIINAAPDSLVLNTLT